MIHLNQKIGSAHPDSHALAAPTLTLAFDDRRKSRLRTHLDDGREAAIQLPRGSSLRDGDRLLDVEANLVVVVRAAREELSMARALTASQLVRAAYHLGNRHVPVELGAGWLAYPRDHVLDDMVAALGLSVAPEWRRFQPEAGGYQHGHGGPREGTHGHEPAALVER